MATAAVAGTSPRLLNRLLTAVAVVCVYLFASLGTTGTLLGFGATKAEARGRRGRGRRGRGRRGRGRRGRRGRGGIYLWGGSYCSIQRAQCADMYGWGGGRYYRCVRRMGC